MEVFSFILLAGIIFFIVFVPFTFLLKRFEKYILARGAEHRRQHDELVANIKRRSQAPRRTSHEWLEHPDIRIIKQRANLIVTSLVTGSPTDIDSGQRQIFKTLESYRQLDAYGFIDDVPFYPFPPKGFDPLIQDVLIRTNFTDRLMKMVESMISIAHYTEISKDAKTDGQIENRFRKLIDGLKTYAHLLEGDYAILNRSTEETMAMLKRDFLSEDSLSKIIGTISPSGVAQ